MPVEKPLVPASPEAVCVYMVPAVVPVNNIEVLALLQIVVLTSTVEAVGIGRIVTTSFKTVPAHPFALGVIL